MKPNTMESSQKWSLIVGNSSTLQMYIFPRGSFLIELIIIDNIYTEQLLKISLIRNPFFKLTSVEYFLLFPENGKYGTFDVHRIF